MKNYAMKRHIIYLVAICAMLISCGEVEMPQPAPPAFSGETTEIEIRFAVPQASTRSFFDEVGNFTERENKITNIRLYLHGADGKQIITFNLTGSALDTPVATIEVPRELCGQQCTLFAIANSPGGQVPLWANSMYTYDQSYFLWRIYNTAVEDHLAGKMTSSFMMSGVAEFYLQPYGKKTMVGVELTRLLSKAAFRYRIDDDFRANHGGAMIRIDKTVITNMAPKSYVFQTPQLYYHSTSTLGTFEQEPLYRDGYYLHVFYFYEMRYTGGYPTKVIMSGTYDYDGDFSTVGDQTPFTLDFPISPDENGVIERNTYYKIDGVIMGIGARNLDLEFTIRNWNEKGNNIIL